MIAKIIESKDNNNDLKVGENDQNWMYAHDDTDRFSFVNLYRILVGFRCWILISELKQN